MVLMEGSLYTASLLATVEDKDFMVGSESIDLYLYAENITLTQTQSSNGSFKIYYEDTNASGEVTVREQVVALTFTDGVADANTDMGQKTVGLIYNGVNNPGVRTTGVFVEEVKAFDAMGNAVTLEVDYYRTISYQ